MFGAAADGDGGSDRPESRLLQAALLPQFSQWLQDVNGVRRSNSSGNVPPPPLGEEAVTEFRDPLVEDVAAMPLVPPPLNRAADAAANGDDQSAAEELHALLRRCHHSLPFVGLFLVYFAYQHTTGIVVFFMGTVAIMGLDQRMRAQVALKDKASELRLLGIVAMCAVYVFALCCVDGDPNPLRHFARTFARDSTRDSVFWDVLWTVVVNGEVPVCVCVACGASDVLTGLSSRFGRSWGPDFLIRLWSVAAKAAVAVVKADRLRWFWRKRPAARGSPVVPAAASMASGADGADATADAVNDDLESQSMLAPPRAPSTITFYRRKVRVAVVHVSVWRLRS